MASRHGQSRRLTRSATDRRLSGVCGGLGAYFGVKPVIFRLGFVVFTLVTQIVPGLIIYLLMTLAMPADPQAPAWSNFFGPGAAPKAARTSVRNCMMLKNTTLSQRGSRA